ncbi:MipA/OmpV family protein [Duganella phyllosphaerae]|uniref:MltA-interacting protein MipA n=1 Tax=Duganella phyllosphaerae TaxID=762836 RepID=A0A1E7WZM6_9BURK|nr:MipA/OmpV family protein [Duganella phyllosphaerae]OFA05395.1 MltA-interacting protein MipA [Duganella phyllosphaerae]
MTDTLRPSLLAASAALLAIAITTPAAHSAELTVNYLLGDKLEAAIGAGVRVAPRYMVSRDTTTTFVPVVYAQRGIFFIDSSRGAGLQVLTDSGFYVSQSIHYDQGRGVKSDLFRPGGRDLAGMGEVPGSATWHTLLAQQVTPALSISAEADVTLKSHVDRQNLRVGAEWNVIDAGDERVALGANVHVGNARYNQAYFGVTDAQAANTRFSAYRAPGGLYAYSVSAQWEHKLADHWYSSVQLTAMPFVERAKDSPLMARKTPVEAMMTIRYVY